MKVFDWFIVCCFSMCAATLGWALWPIDPPITELPGATITKTAKSLGEITITRSLAVTRAETVYVQRTLVRGDCANSCEIADLPSGNLTLPIGTYLNLPRDHILPMVVEPGKWKAVFFIHWRDRLNRVQIYPMQELQFVVLP